jgi:hypothetical protein
MTHGYELKKKKKKKERARKNKTSTFLSDKGILKTKIPVV